MKLALTTLALLITGQAYAGLKQDEFKVIYGEDDRLDVRDVSNGALLEASRATAAMIPHVQMEAANAQGIVELLEINFQQRMSMCSSERFITQQANADCSGFLVAPDLIVTAGHCSIRPGSCANNAWVFDYRLDIPGQDAVVVRQENVYRCKELVKVVLDDSNKDDYAVIRLDRPVTDRTPLRFRTAGRPAMGDKLVVIGHPSGLPTKVSGGAQVIRNTNDIYFEANLDTYGGNSGSAVLNSETLEVEGILVRGARDYTSDPVRQCRLSNRLPDNSPSAESCTYITNVKEIMPQ